MVGHGPQQFFWYILSGTAFSSVIAKKLFAKLTLFFPESGKRGFFMPLSIFFLISLIPAISPTEAQAMDIILKTPPKITSHQNGGPMFIHPKDGVTLRWDEGTVLNYEEAIAHIQFMYIDKKYFTEGNGINTHSYLSTIHICNDITLGAEGVCHVPYSAFNVEENTDKLIYVYFMVIIKNKFKITRNYTKAYLFEPTHSPEDTERKTYGNVIIKFKSNVNYLGEKTKFSMSMRHYDNMIAYMRHKYGIIETNKVFKRGGFRGIKGKDFDRVLFDSLNELNIIYSLKYIKSINAKDFCQDLMSSMPMLEFCQPNYLLTIAESSAESSDTFRHSEGSWGQSFADMWGLNKTKADQTWSHTQGEGVKVAVIDTGIDYHHPDIKNNIWINPDEDINGNGKIDGFDTCPIPNGDFNCKDDDKNGHVDDIAGYDFASCKKYGTLKGLDDAGCMEGKGYTSNPMDLNGHGTHVAGIIAAQGNNGIGIVGTAPKAKVMAVKSFNSQGISDSASVAQAIIYATLSGADVINNSFSGGQALNPVVELVIQKAREAGVVVIQAAGNDFQKDVRQLSPQRLKETITVGATNVEDDLTVFSNTGQKVDVYAPGFEILSLNAREGNNALVKQFNMKMAAHPEKSQYDRVVNDSDGKPHYLRLNGTSSSAAFVSGISALLLSGNPNMSQEEIRTRLKHSSAHKAITSVNAPSAIFTAVEDLPNLPDLAGEEALDENFNHEIVSITDNFLQQTGIELRDLDLFQNIVFTPVVTTNDRAYLDSVTLQNKNDDGLNIIKDLGDKLEFVNEGDTLYLYLPLADYWATDILGAFLFDVNGYDHASTIHMVDQFDADRNLFEAGGREYADNADTPDLVFSRTTSESVNDQTSSRLPFISDQEDLGQIHILPDDFQRLETLLSNEFPDAEINVLESLKELYIRTAHADAQLGDNLMDIIFDKDTIVRPKMISPIPGTSLSKSNITFNWSQPLKNYEYLLLVGTCKDLNPCMGNIFQKHLDDGDSASLSSLDLNGSEVYVKLAYRPRGEDVPWEYDLYTYQTAELDHIHSLLKAKDMFSLTNPGLFGDDLPAPSAVIPYALTPETQKTIFPLSNVHRPKGIKSELILSAK